MPIAYKILTSEQADALRHNNFAGAPADIRDGYIHLSTAAQVTETLEKHFAGQTGLWLAAIDLEKCGAELRWEVSRGEQIFPHFYGVLTMAQVPALAPMERAADGSLVLPISL
jgi:uncharacterized protein (DUF952 family)